MTKYNKTMAFKALHRWLDWVIRGLFAFYLGLSLLGFARLLPAVGQPFGGFTWLRDDVHGFSVGYESGMRWPGRQAGLLLDDRILRIQGREIPLDGDPDVVGEVYQHAEIGQLITYHIERQGHIYRIDVPVTRFRWHHLLEAYGAFYAAGLALWGLGIFVHLVSPRSEESVVFTFLCLLFSTLLFSHNFSGFIHKFFDARWTTFLIYAPIWPLFNAVVIHFISIFPEHRPWWRKIWPWVYGSATLIAVLYTLSFSPWLDAHLSDPMLILTTLSSVVACLYGLGLFIHTARHSPSPKVQRQIKMMGLGMGMGGMVPLLLMSTYILFRPYQHVWWAPTNITGARLVKDWLLPLPLQLLFGAVIFPFFVAFAILRYKTFNAKPALVKMLATTVLAGVLVVLYTLSVNILRAIFDLANLDHLLFQVLGEPIDWLWVNNFLATLLIAVLFAPLRYRIYQLVRRLLYPYRLTVSEALARLLEAAWRVNHPAALSHSESASDLPYVISATLQDILHLQSAFIWFYFPVSHELHLVSGESSGMRSFDKLRKTNDRSFDKLRKTNDRSFDKLRMTNDRSFDKLRKTSYTCIARNTASDKLGMTNNASPSDATETDPITPILLSRDVLQSMLQASPPVLSATAPELAALQATMTNPTSQADCSPPVEIYLPLIFRGQELVGLVGLGPRRDAVPFGPEDYDLLIPLASHLLLLLKNERTIHALQQSRERLNTMQEIERKRIAQDLHDETLQYLSCLATVQLELCKRAVSDPEQVLHMLQNIQEETRQAVRDLRAILATISPAIITNRGLVSALRSLVDIERSHLNGQKSEIHLHIGGYQDKMLPESHELAIFRYVQEALHNAVYHAQAHRVAINLERRESASPPYLIVTIQDDGIGFDPKRLSEIVREGHMGLQNMRDRIETLDGALFLESELGEGTTVRAEIPLRHDQYEL